MATGLPGICFINKREKLKMSNFKVSVQHEHEEKIADYCAKNNIDFNLANAYDVVLETFKDQPITYLSRDNVTGEETKHTVTDRIARTIECQIRMVERINEKAALKKITPSQVTDGLSGLSGNVEGGIKLCPPPPPPQAESMVDKVNAATKDNLFISLSISHEYQIIAYYTKTNICDRLWKNRFIRKAKKTSCYFSLFFHSK